MEKDYSERVCVCALNRLLGFEPGVAHGLIGAAGSARALFGMSPDEKLAMFGPYSRIAPLLEERELRKSEEELGRLQDAGCSFMTITDPGYPELLRECEDAPPGALLQGRFTAGESLQPEAADRRRGHQGHFPIR